MFFLSFPLAYILVLSKNIYVLSLRTTSANIIYSVLTCQVFSCFFLLFLSFFLLFFFTFLLYFYFPLYYSRFLFILLFPIIHFFSPYPPFLIPLFVIYHIFWFLRMNSLFRNTVCAIVGGRLGRPYKLPPFASFYLLTPSLAEWTVGVPSFVFVSTTT